MILACEHAPHAKLARRPRLLRVLVGAAGGTVASAPSGLLMSAAAADRTALRRSLCSRQPVERWTLATHRGTRYGLLR